MAMSDAPAHRGRVPRRADESRSEPAQPAAAMGVAKKSVFVLVVVARPEGKGKSDEGRGKSDKGKRKRRQGRKEIGR